MLVEHQEKRMEFAAGVCHITVQTDGALTRRTLGQCWLLLVPLSAAGSLTLAVVQFSTNTITTVSKERSQRFLFFPPFVCSHTRVSTL